MQCGETGRRSERYVEEYRPERTRDGQLRGRPADLKNTKGQGHEQFCDFSMAVRNGNLGNDRTTTKAAKTTGYEK